VLEKSVCRLDITDWYFFFLYIYIYIFIGMLHYIRLVILHAITTGTYVQKSVCLYVTPHCCLLGLLVNERNFAVTNVTLPNKVMVIRLRF
jgi:hypothetical protein